MIDQVVFTSAKTDRSRGYQLVSASPGIGSEDARELAAWGPSHGSLCDGGPSGSSVNFYPLPSGRWCVGQSVAAGEEYSGRGGARVYTQSFIVDSDSLARFANNPFAVLRALRNQGLLTVENSPLSTLPSIELPGASPAVDEGVLANLVEHLGVERLLWLVETLTAADSLVIVGAVNRELLLAGLLNCFPAECRLELSFATGLVYSQRRPFRINAVSADNTEARRLKRQPQITVFDLGDNPPADFCPSGWAGYLVEALATDGLAIVASELARSRPGLRLADLSDLAEQLSQNLHDGGFRSTPMISDVDNDSSPIPQWLRSTNGTEPDNQLPAHESLSRLRPTAAIASPNIGRISGPSTTLIAPSREVLEQLEHLDDLVFDTINGRQPALDELRECWPALANQLPAELLAESREQYLGYAIKLWQSQGGDGPRDPAWAVAALDVLSILFGGG
ncbi:MAG TPA: hypothetical protein VKB78_16215 [Pirellulales bacterium]|nr:hypothetical protein [Pirellulales bacterium]